MDDSESPPDYAGMTVNERLFAAGLLEISSMRPPAHAIGNR
jgi:hypothetical protein